MGSQVIDDILDQLHDLLVGVQIATLPAWLENGLTPAQVRCLFAVRRAGPLSLGALAASLRISSPTACAVVDQLVKLDLVARTPDDADRRRVLLTVTARGADLVASVRESGRLEVRTWLATLSDAEILPLDAALKPLLAAMRARAPGQRAEAEAAGEPAEATARPAGAAGGRAERRRPAP